jgi:hypothetical protein
MSLEAAMILYNVGFTKIAVLDGGLNTWYSTGYPINGQLLTPTPGFAPIITIAPLGTVTPLPTATSRSTVTSQPSATVTLQSTATVTATVAQ